MLLEHEGLLNGLPDPFLAIPGAVVLALSRPAAGAPTGASQTDQWALAPHSVLLGLLTRGRPTGALQRFLRWTRTDATAKRLIAARYVLP